MHNIKFNYLYRDASNYKQFGYIVLSNSNNIAIDIIRENIISNLIDTEYFFADALGIPSLFFDEANEDDHLWHEFKSIEFTHEKADTKTSIEAFLYCFKVKQLN